MGMSSITGVFAILVPLSCLGITYTLKLNPQGMRHLNMALEIFEGTQITAPRLVCLIH